MILKSVDLKYHKKNKCYPKIFEQLIGMNIDIEKSKFYISKKLFDDIIKSINGGLPGLIYTHHNNEKYKIRKSNFLKENQVFMGTRREFDEIFLRRYPKDNMGL